MTPEISNRGARSPTINSRAARDAGADTTGQVVRGSEGRTAPGRTPERFSDHTGRSAERAISIGEELLPQQKRGKETKPCLPTYGQAEPCSTASCSPLLK